MSTSRTVFASTHMYNKGGPGELIELSVLRNEQTDEPIATMEEAIEHVSKSVERGHGEVTVTEVILGQQVTVSQKVETSIIVAQH